MQDTTSKRDLASDRIRLRPAGITSSAIYTAPAVGPSPNALQVMAVIRDEQTQWGTANVTISNAPNILTRHPASVYAGGTNGFAPRVDGSGFLASSNETGSTLLLGGAARITNCASGDSCCFSITSPDAAQAGPLTVSVKNPGGTVSNVSSLIVVAPNASDDVITLTSGTGRKNAFHSERQSGRHDGLRCSRY